MMEKTHNPSPLSRRAILKAAAAVAAAGASGHALAQSLSIGGETIADDALLKAARAEGVMFSYAANFEDQERALLARFREDTSVQSDMIRLQTGRLYERTSTEYSAGKLKADVVSLNDREIMDKMVAAGIYSPHKPPSWSEIPAALKDAAGHYYCQQRYAVGIGYNSSAWSDAAAPKRWADLLHPRFKGQIGVIPISSGGNAYCVSMFQKRVVDPQYWEKLAANGARVYSSFAPLADDIARGEVTVGVSTPGLITKLIDAGAPVGFVAGEEGVPTAELYVGVCSVAANPNQARLYVNWITSKRGAAYVAQISQDYPGRNDVPPADLSKYGIRLPTAEKLWTPSREELTTQRDQNIREWDRLLRTSR